MEEKDKKNKIREEAKDRLSNISKTPNNFKSNETQELVKELIAQKTELELKDLEIQDALALLEKFRSREKLLLELEVHQIELELQNEELLNTQRKLEESREKYIDLYDFAPVGYITLDNSGTIISANLTIASLLNVERRELINKRFNLFIESDSQDKYYFNQQATQKEKLQQTCELRLKRKNKEHIFVKIQSLKSEDNTVRVIISDITEIKKVENEKRQLEIRLIEQQRLESVGVLASGIAHEINNPINGIMNYAQLIYKRLKGDEDLREFSLQIIKESDRIAKIVKNLLTFSKTEKGLKTAAKVDDLINDTVSLLSALFKRENIQLNVDISQDLPQIICNGQEIRQIIINLLSNARDSLNIKYPNANENKVINLYANHVINESGEWLKISIEDHGVGIPAELCHKVFDPFFTTKNRAIGTGLGLSISYGLTKEHNGKLYFISEAGKFTRFYLELPIQQDL